MMSSAIRRMEKEASLVYKLQLHIKPGAKQSRIMDVKPECIDLQISAPPRDGEANEEVVRFVAESLGLRQRNVELVAGMKSREKTILLRLDITDKRTEQQILEKFQSCIEH